ncbi:hypothetical protein [Bartonella sp. TP]|nr:hypothetical protein [Bartonella sp. TP]WJW79974.1 hypothetical protein QVL57_05600 [Bartonella sp. TP]
MEKLMEELTNKIKDAGTRRFTISCTLEFEDTEQNIAIVPKSTLKAASSL